jgi:hypothetical protein
MSYCPTNNCMQCGRYRKIIVELEQKIKELRAKTNTATGDICPTCFEHKVSLPSKNKKICSCGLTDWFIKPGEKSTLEKNKELI